MDKKIIQATMIATWFVVGLFIGSSLGYMQTPPQQQTTGITMLTPAVMDGQPAIAIFNDKHQLEGVLPVQQSLCPKR